MAWAQKALVREASTPMAWAQKALVQKELVREVSAQKELWVRTSRCSVQKDLSYVPCIHRRTSN